MGTNLLNIWATHLTNPKKGYWLHKNDVDKYISLLEKFFTRDYFENVNSSVKYGHEDWLKFLLSNTHKVYTYAAIEFCQILEAFDSTQFEPYLIKKIKSKEGKIDENLFKGNYHELFTAFIFKVNGLEYLPDSESETTIYDGVSRSFGNACLIECKEILSEDRVLKIHNLNFHIHNQLEKYVKRNVIIGGGNNRPFISGYIQLGGNINSVKEDFNLHLKHFQHYSDKKPLIEKYKSGKICIEDFKEGLMQHYPFERNEIGMRFESRIDGAQIELTLPSNKDLQLKRILKAISKKRQQHRKESFPIKLISIGLTSYLFSRPFTIELLKENEERILRKLKDDTIALFIIRNLLNDKEYDLKVYVICNAKFDSIKKRLSSMDLKFISMNQSKWIF